MVQNLVLNNSDHNFSAHADAIRISDDQAKVVATPGTDAAVNANLRGQLESGALAASGKGVLAEYSA
jgi:hypothetical protein